MKMYLIKKKIKRLILLGLVLSSFFFSVLVFQNELLSCLFRKKIWAHRVNSLEKLEEAYHKFPGVELDIVFLQEKGIFDVTHPPVPSIGLTLENYFSSQKINKEYGFWLDFKNLDKDNCIIASRKLLNLVDSLQINKNNIIIESTNPEYLSYFSNNGFKTSYYLPISLYKLKGRPLKDKLADVKTKIQLSETDFISANVNNYQLMKENFPNKKILTWNVLIDPPNINSLYRFKIAIEKLYRKYNLLNDKYVIVALDDFNAKKGNR